MGDNGVVLHVVGYEGRELLADLFYPRFVFFEEDGAAAVVEGSPHEAVVAEAEDEEVAWGFLAEHVKGYGDFG